MEGFQVLLNEKQTKELQKFVYDLTNEAIKKAIHDVSSDKDFLNQREMSDWLGVSIN
ncbi:DNA-binding protein, partial [Enterococcus hirae]|nr:DNA-binding protein [Enterococcus hirae]